jgi:hypothetical protein
MAERLSVLLCYCLLLRGSFDKERIFIRKVLSLANDNC